MTAKQENEKLKRELADAEVRIQGLAAVNDAFMTIGEEPPMTRRFLPLLIEALSLVSFLIFAAAMFVALVLLVVP